MTLTGVPFLLLAITATVAAFVAAAAWVRGPGGRCADSRHVC